MQDITNYVNEITDRIYDLSESHPRVLVAVAGAPGSGKSTLASEVARRLTMQKRRNAVVPMDGFHLDNSLLEERGLMPRKGAPETFDAKGFLRLVRALADQEDVVAPAFDRKLDKSIAGMIAVPGDCPIVLVEGNYLMFDEAPWRRLSSLWTLSVRLDVPMPELRARLIHRWLSHNLSRTAATRRAESNDIPNAQRVIDNALLCDMTLRHGA